MSKTRHVSLLLMPLLVILPNIKVNCQSLIDFCPQNDVLEKKIMDMGLDYVFEDVSAIQDTLFGIPLTKDGKKKFQRVMDGIYSSFIPGSVRSESEAIRFFKTADSVTKSEGIEIIYGGSESLNQELSLSGTTFDCDLMMVVYSTASQSMPFDIKFSILPGPHVFARYMIDDSTYFNWDSNYQKHVSDEWCENYYFDGKQKDTPWHEYLTTIDSKEAFSIIFYNQGSEMFNKNRFEKAVSYFDIVNALLPNYFLSVENIIESYFSAEDWDELKDVSQTVKEFDSTYHTAFYYNALAHSKLGESDTALQLYNEGISLFPDATDFYYGRSLEYLNRGNLELAEQDFKTYSATNNFYTSKAGDLYFAIKNYKKEHSIEEENDKEENN